MTERSWSRLLPVLAIIAVGSICYGGTLGASFQFDDYNHIIENPKVADHRAVLGVFYDISGQLSIRPLTLATFVLNHFYGDFDPAGYHIVNISLHILNGLLLYLLVLETLEYLRVADQCAALAAVFSALIFVAHPLQTESVTYITTRSVLLCSMFYLSGLIVFVRHAAGKIKRPVAMVMMVLTGLMGAASREDFATFIAVILMFDYLVVSGGDFKKMRGNLPVHASALLAYPYLLYLVSSSDMHSGSAGFTSGTGWTDYFTSQFRVHIMYLRLLFLPINQNVDYDFPYSGSLAAPATLISFAGYAGMWAGALYMRRVSAWVSFCMLWFMVTLTPASSVVPLANLAFEHRLYLPIAGPAVCMPLLVVYITNRKTGSYKPAALILGVIVLLSTVLTMNRNAVWETRISLWDDVVTKSPMKGRGYLNLGAAYRASEMHDKGLEVFSKGVSLAPLNAELRNSLGSVYMFKGMEDRAIMELNLAVSLDPLLDNARYNLGNLYLARKDYVQAIRNFDIAISQGPTSPVFRYRRALAYFEYGRPDRALEGFLAAESLDPESIRIKIKIIEALKALGRDAEAEERLRPLLEQAISDPRN